MRWQKTLGSLWLLTLLFVAPTAGAQEAMGAEVTFDEGVKLMKAGRFAEACPKIAESQRLEPRPGTLFTLAECHLREGRLATALARYEEYLRVFQRMSRDEQKRQRGREEVAQKSKRELLPRVPRIKLTLPKGAPTGTRVMKGSVELGAASLDTWLPVDPGKQELVVTTPSGRSRTTDVELPEGKSVELTLELPGEEAPNVTPVPVTKPKKRGLPKERERPRSRSVAPSRNDTLAYVAFGVGAAGLAVGTFAGILVLSKKSQIDANCGIGGDEHACNDTGTSKAESAQTLALVSNIGFAVGLVGAGTGTVLLLTGASSNGSQSASMGMRGQW